MGLLEFNKLPINTLVGADWDTFRKVTAGQQIDPRFKGKYRLTTAVGRLLSSLKPLEDSRYKKLADKPLEMDPLFILGHWRSGGNQADSSRDVDKEHQPQERKSSGFNGLVGSQLLTVRQADPRGFLGNRGWQFVWPWLLDELSGNQHYNQVKGA